MHHKTELNRFIHFLINKRNIQYIRAVPDEIEFKTFPKPPTVGGVCCKVASSPHCSRITDPIKIISAHIKCQASLRAVLVKVWIFFFFAHGKLHFSHWKCIGKTLTVLSPCCCCNCFMRIDLFLSLQRLFWNQTRMTRGLRPVISTSCSFMSASGLGFAL